MNHTSGGQVPSEVFLTSAEFFSLLPVRRATRIKSLSNGFRDDLIFCSLDVGLEILSNKRINSSEARTANEVILASRTGESLNGPVSSWPVGVYVIVPRTGVLVDDANILPTQYINYAWADAFPDREQAMIACESYRRLNF